jgi:hypothetical protein
MLIWSPFFVVIHKVFKILDKPMKLNMKLLSLTFDVVVKGVLATFHYMFASRFALGSTIWTNFFLASP